MDKKLSLAVEALYHALTTVWENNGNIMADAVRDSVLYKLSEITGQTLEQIETSLEKMVEESQ